MVKLRVFLLFALIFLWVESFGQSQPPVVKSDSTAELSNAETAEKAQITRIRVGFGPQGIAFTDGAAWVAYGNDKDFGVARVDSNTSKVLVTIPTGKWPVGVAAGEGAVWIVNRDDNSVTRVDPNSNHPVATIPVGKKPLGVDVGEGSIWVTNTGERSVSRIDPQKNSVIATIHLGNQPSGITVSSGSVWVVNFGGALSSGSLSRIDPKTNTVKTIKIPGRPNVVVSDGTNVWAGDQFGVVVRVDSKTGDVVQKFNVGQGLSGLAIGKHVLWAVLWNQGMLLKIDPHSNAVLEKIMVGNNPVIFGHGVDANGAIWVSNSGDGTVVSIKP